MKELINRKDKMGIQLREGDIVAECNIGDIIWDGKGQVVSRPLGVVVVYNHQTKPVLAPEESDFYNVVPLRVGRVKILDNSGFMQRLDDGTGYSEIHLSKYDGDFYAWDNIEKIGSIYDFAD